MAGRSLLISASLVAVALFSGVACGQAFYLTGIGPNGQASRVFGLSADGSVASGWSNGPNTGHGFVWSPGTGRYDFGTEPGIPWISPGYGISGNGAVVVGSAGVVGSPPIAYRWSGPGTYESLGVTGGYDRSYAVGVSNDGSVIAGRLEFGITGNIGQAFRWTEGGGYQLLGVTRPGQHGFSQSMGVSRDGSTVVGISRGAESQAFVWTTALGMQELPVLPNSASAAALGVNHDGSIIVGSSGQLPRAVMWVNGQIMDLGLASGYSFSGAAAVNDTGSVVVGGVSEGNQAVAAVWTPSRGMEPLSNYLAFHGVTVPAGITLRESTAVSADGMVIAGRTSGTTNQGFVVVIPSPATLPLIAVCVLFAPRRRRTAP